MFVDSSVFMAILLAEPDGDELMARLKASKRKPVTSGMVRYEVVISLARSAAHGGRISERDVEQAQAAFDDLVAAFGIYELSITDKIARTACDLARRFGKVAGHPAQLNMGDCFSLAAAEVSRLPLLYKGQDFAAITRAEMDELRRGE